MKQKTPLQTLITQINELQAVVKNPSNVAERVAYNRYSECIDLAQSLLPKEKEVIEKSHSDFARSIGNYPDSYLKRVGEDYYTQTFETE